MPQRQDQVARRTRVPVEQAHQVAVQIALTARVPRDAGLCARPT